MRRTRLGFRDVAWCVTHLQSAVRSHALHVLWACSAIQSAACVRHGMVFRGNVCSQEEEKKKKRRRKEQETMGGKGEKKRGLAALTLPMLLSLCSTSFTFSAIWFHPHARHVTSRHISTPTHNHADV
eukprot:177250-Rhodomonas_salina.2